MSGVSGSGKTTLILESLIPALQAKAAETALPEHVKSVEAEGIAQVKLIDATPIGINVRSTVATYANVHDELRKLFAKTPDAKERGYKAGDSCGVPPATAPASSVWTCSFCRTWKWSVRTAAAPATGKRPRR